MALYIVHYEPQRTAKDRPGSYVRDITITFSAPNNDRAHEMVRQFMITLFVNTGHDFMPAWRKL